MDKSLLDQMAERFSRLGIKIDNARTLSHPMALRVMRGTDVAGLMQYLRDSQPAARQEALKLLTDAELDDWQTVIQLVQMLRKDASDSEGEPAEGGNGS